MKSRPLQWLVVAAVIAVVAVAALPTANSPPAAAASAEDDDDNSGGDGGLDDVFPFKAIQLYNTMASYLEYIYDIVIAPITGKY